MNVLGSIFARNALREITHSRLRGCERRKVRLAPQAARGAREKQRPAAMLEEYWNRGLGQLISTQCVLTPMPREALFADLHCGPQLSRDARPSQIDALSLLLSRAMHPH